jgi:fucose permease
MIGKVTILALSEFYTYGTTKETVVFVAVLVGIMIATIIAAWLIKRWSNSR